jgi:hypothetical protein
MSAFPFFGSKLFTVVDKLFFLDTCLALDLPFGFFLLVALFCLSDLLLLLFFRTLIATGDTFRTVFLRFYVRFQRACSTFLGRSLFLSFLFLIRLHISSFSFLLFVAEAAFCLFCAFAFFFCFFFCFFWLFHFFIYLFLFLLLASSSSLLVSPSRCSP